MDVVRLNERILESREGLIGGISDQENSTIKQRPAPPTLANHLQLKQYL